MNSRKKIINELRFQLDSKEVKDQHYPVQLSASDAIAILALLKEQEVVRPDYEPTTLSWSCGNCGQPFDRCKYKYCPNCGQAVKWDD